MVVFHLNQTRSSSIFSIHFLGGHLSFFFEVSIFCWGRHSSFSKNWGRLSFCFFLRSSSIFYWGRLSSWVKIRLNTKNQLLGFAWKCIKSVCGGGCLVRWGRTHDVVNPKSSWGWVGQWQYHGILCQSAKFQSTQRGHTIYIDESKMDSFLILCIV
jgi:hypothetical protein